MKWTFLLLITLSTQIVLGQIQLRVEGNTPNLHIPHTVGVKETLYSISRAFNITPKALANYNNLDINTKLYVDQVILIPLTTNNFLQANTKYGEDLLIPVYHVVQPKEGLYRISINHNKVSMNLLKSWNQLVSDTIHTGANLIVGYLRTKQGQLAFVDTKKPESIIPSKVPASNPTTPIPPIINTRHNDTIVQTSATNTNTSMIGFFEDAYINSIAGNVNLQNVSGYAASFKSTSGWQDKKYYALMNNIPPGTFIKIHNAANNTHVFAKVLGNLPEMKENDGLIIRISNAAAAVLGMNDAEKITVQIIYKP